MAFIESSNDLNVYITRRFRDYIGTGNLSNCTFDKVGLGDSDVDYGFGLPIPSGFLPDAVGSPLSGLDNIASNVVIRNPLLVSDTGTEVFSLLMRNPNSPIGFQLFRKKSPLLVYDNSPSGNFTFSSISRSGSSPLRNILSSLGLPITDLQSDSFDSKYSNTGLSELNQDTYLILDFPKNLYEEMIIGNTIKLVLPKSGGGNWTIYGRYYSNPSVTEPYSKLFSDTNDFSQDFGGVKTQYDPFNTNIAYLFSDDIMPPVSSGQTSWETSEYAVFSDSRQKPLCSTGTTLYTDKCIGIAYLDKGFIAISNPDIVAGFDYASSTFDASFTANWTAPLPKEILYNPDAIASFKTVKTQYIQSANFVIQASEFNRSSNPTFVETAPSLQITEIGLYNSLNELLVYAKPKVPIEKIPNVTDFPISIKVFL